jgi:membrane-associated phospholipid phosphatase
MTRNLVNNWMTDSDCLKNPSARFPGRKSSISLLIASAISLALPAAAGAQSTYELPDAPQANRILLAVNARANVNPDATADTAPLWSSSVAAFPDPAQQSSPTPSTPPNASKTICGVNHLGRCIKDLGEDDKGIFTSPSRLQSKDGLWLVSLTGASVLAFSYDQQAQNAIGPNPSYKDTATSISNIGSFFATGGEGAAIYFVGLAKHNPKLAETGRLGSEAVLGSGTVVLVGKLLSNRQRPYQGDGKGHFWPQGTSQWTWDSSFPSDHAAASMALARVVAGEYPRWYVAVPAYGFAEGVSALRFLGKQHFPSDIILGQAVGFLTGTYMLNHRADYRPKKNDDVARRMMHSVLPIANAQTRTFGVAMQLPFGR